MVDQAPKPIALLGAGAWGTALALYLARRGQTVRFWSIEISEITAMQAERTNNQYLPGFNFPDTLHPIANLKETVENIEDVLIVVPSIGFRNVVNLIKPFINPHTRILSATKGLDAETAQLPNEIVMEILGKDRKFAVLSGPSFAREVASGLPTAVVIASQDKKFLADLIQRFDSPIFHTHPSDDITGTEIGGVVKNVIAIATGVSDGLQMGSNTRSTLITYGLAEIIRLGKAMGGKAETFLGLSGIGDLILTCSDNQSRNRRLGLAIGKGNSIQEAEREIGQVVEGKRNAELVNTLAHRHRVKMPVSNAMWEILQGNISAKEGIQKMLAVKI